MGFERDEIPSWGEGAKPLPSFLKPRGRAKQCPRQSPTPPAGNPNRAGERSNARASHPLPRQGTQAARASEAMPAPVTHSPGREPKPRGRAEQCPRQSPTPPAGNPSRAGERSNARASHPLPRQGTQTARASEAMPAPVTHSPDREPKPRGRAKQCPRQSPIPPAGNPNRAGERSNARASCPK